MTQAEISSSRASTRIVLSWIRLLPGVLTRGPEFSATSSSDLPGIDRSARPRVAAWGLWRFVPDGEIAKRGRPVLGPIVNRRRFELIQPRVVVPTVMLQCFEAGLALRGVELATREQHSSSVDAI